MVNKTMGTHQGSNQDRNRTGTPGTPGERREGMGRDQEQRHASRTDTGRQNQSDQSKHGSQSGSRDQGGRSSH